MSQPATEPPAGARAGGGNLLTRKIGGVPGWAWLVVIGGGIGAFLWIRGKKSSSSSTDQSQDQSSGSSQTCYDANGNTVDCSSPSAVGSNATDEFESLYAQNEGINSQLETIGPEVSTTGTNVDTIEQLVQALQGSGGVTGTTPNQSKPGPVTDLTVDVISPTLARVSWRPPQYASTAPTSTTYTIQVTPKDAAPHNIGSRTSYNVGALKANTSYTAVVAASGGPSSSKAFKTPKRATAKKAA